ncbi:MAG: macrolide ABC transporter ATP-binding protein [Candidatus Hydrothermarchaeota archaeon]|nr:MAG: macrolide ABC transporter ATP-binding protein [Candidatus Hydrothermarchaeota archaeon]
MKKPVVRLEKVTKVYRMGEVRVFALRRIDLSIKKEEFVCIAGPSGSGKSTLLHIIGCLDKPTSGKVFLDSIDISELNSSQLAKIRGRKIGFVFQFYNLYPTLNALENVELPMMIMKVDKEKRRKKAEELLESVGLGNRLYHLPSQLSGGERQRVAIARALANDPALILADEPTGNVDSKAGEEIMEIFKELNEEGRTIVIVTHEESIIKSGIFNKIVKMKDGLIEEII